MTFALCQLCPKLFLYYFLLLFLQTMHAHSQFCLSGDTTLQATRHAITTLAKEEADDRFVIILSDANFDRYGISPAKFGQILRSDDQVNAYAIFIGSLGDQAIRSVNKVLRVDSSRIMSPTIMWHRETCCSCAWCLDDWIYVTEYFYAP